MSQLEPEIDDETLVAFIDGELTAEEVRRIDQLIATDSQLQRRVADLRSSWQLLDDLPAAKLNPQLAQTTIELIALSLSSSSSTGLWNLLLRYRLPALIVSTIAAVGLGFSVSSWQAYQQKKSIVDDLMVLVNFQDLDDVDSQAWLDKLASIENLEQAGMPLYEERTFPNLPKATSDFEGWVDALDINQKLSLQEAFRSFAAASPERQTNLRTIAKQVADAGTDKTHSLIKAYSALLRRINIVEAVQIKDEKDLDLRAKQVQEVVRREMAIGYANNLSEEEKSRIQDWCDDLKDSSLDFFDDAEIVRLLGIEPIESNFRSDDIANLIQCIEPAGRELLQNLEPQLQTKLLKLWVYNSLPSTQPKPQYTATELLDRLHKLPGLAQNELIYSPSYEVIRILTEDPSQPDTSNAVDKQ
jgi:hypothetical protein